MCYWPEEDPKYDPNKSRVENYQYLHKSMVDYIESFRGRCSGGLDEACIVFTDRKFKGVHLDWNYTEMLRDLIDQGLVKVPITDFDVVFVEWASGNLDNVPDSYKTYKALCNWDGKNAYYVFDRLILDDDNFDQEDEIKLSTIKIYFYNDSNREEYIPTPAETTPVVPTVSSPATVESKQSLNGTDTSQVTVQQPTPVQYGGNQYIVPTQQQNKSWIPNVDYVDPNFIPEWEEQLMMKEALMGAQGRALMQQMGMVPQYQPPQYQTVQPAVPQPPRFTSPEQVVSYILANQPELVYDEITDESINNALEGTFIGADEQ